jgi:hypothetical protein
MPKPSEDHVVLLGAAEIVSIFAAIVKHKFLRIIVIVLSISIKLKH